MTLPWTLASPWMEPSLSSPPRLRRQTSVTTTPEKTRPTKDVVATVYTQNDALDYIGQALTYSSDLVTSLTLLRWSIEKFLLVANSDIDTDQTQFDHMYKLFALANQRAQAQQWDTTALLEFFHALVQARKRCEKHKWTFWQMRVFDATAVLDNVKHCLCQRWQLLASEPGSIQTHRAKAYALALELQLIETTRIFLPTKGSLRTARECAQRLTTPPVLDEWKPPLLSLPAPHPTLSSRDVILERLALLAVEDYPLDIYRDKQTVLETELAALS